MAEPRTRIPSAVTPEHLDVAIRAGLGPVKREMDSLRRDLGEVAQVVDTIADDIVAIAEQMEANRRRLRRWLTTNGTTASVNGAAGTAIAAASALTTYLITHF